MKRLVIDFPRSPSPEIDWESDDENKDPKHENPSSVREVSLTDQKLVESAKRMDSYREQKSQDVVSLKVDAVDLSSYPRSPIISRKRPFFLQRSPLFQDRGQESEECKKSPIISKRREVLPRKQKPGDQRGSRIPVEDPEARAGTIEKEGRCLPRGETKRLVGSSWIADLSRMEDESGDCSQDIITSWGTEDHQAKGREHIKAAHTDRLLGSSWIADLSHMEEEMEANTQAESQGSANIGSWEGEARVQPFGDKTICDIAQSCHDEGMARDLEGRGRSKKALKGGLAEQLERALEWGRAGQALRRHQGDGRGNNVTVERLEQVGECLVVYCTCQGDSTTFPNGGEVGGENPRGGGERLSLMINRLFCPILPVPGQKVLFGPPFTETKDRTGCRLVMGLTGLTLGELGSESVKDGEGEGIREVMNLECPCRSGGICPSSVAHVHASPAPTLSLHTTSSPPCMLTPLSTAVEIAIKGVGDRRMTIEAEVKLIWGSATALHAQQVELLVEEQGKFAVIRPIGSESGWEGVLSGDVDLVIGAKVRVWGMLAIQGRHTRSNHPNLFKVLEGTSVHQHRILYALNITGGGLEILETGKMPEVSLPNLREASGLTPDSRVSIGCRVLHLERSGESGLLYLQDIAGSDLYRVPCDLSSMLVAQVARQSNPFSCIMTSVLVSPSTPDPISTDSYSCLFDCKPILLSGLLLPPSSTVGDLVCVAGSLEEVDMDASTQWLECQDCGCEEVVQGRCGRCGGSQVEKKIQLVAKIGKVWVEFNQERATSLLPDICAAPAKDKDHLDTVEPNTILAVNIPPFLAMTVEGGRLRELKPMGDI